MEFRDLGGGRSVRRPAFDRDELAVEPALFDGDFEYESVRFDGGAATEVRGAGSLSECLVAGVDLTGTRLQPLTLTDVELERVELSGAILQDVTARRVELLRCRAMGLRLALAVAADVYAEGCRFDYATLHLGPGRGLGSGRGRGRSAFRECSFRDGIITGDLSDVVFLDCDFAGTDFRAAAAKGCDLRSSRLVGARGLLTLGGAQITAEQAVSVADQLATEAGFAVVPG